jgi:uncharacterized protein (TIGR03435 family)
MLETAFSQAVEATFGLVLKRETRSVDVFVLKSNATSSARLAGSSSEGREPCFTFNEITADHCSLLELAEGLENAMGKPVLNETGITNVYSFHLKWDQRDFKRPNPEGMTLALKEIGLELMPETRPIDFVVARPVSE